MEALYDLVRASQIETFLGIAAWLDGATVHNLPKEVGVFELNEDDSPGRAVNILDSILEFDPEWHSGESR